jgi:hypothetical protein
MCADHSKFRQIFVSPHDTASMAYLFIMRLGELSSQTPSRPAPDYKAQGDRYTQRENHLRVVSHHRFPSIDRKNRPTLVAADDLGRQQRSR